MSHFPNEPEYQESICVERRQLLKVSLFSLAALWCGRPEQLLAEVAGEEDTLSFDEVMQLIERKATTLVKAKNADEEVYLKQLIEWVNKIQGINHAPASNNQIKFTTMFNEVPVKVYQIRLAPGARLDFHDHRNYNGVMKVLEGSAHVRNYDIVNFSEEVYKKESFEIIETQNVILKAGDISSVSRVRDNIHDVKASEEGVLFLDIFTYFEKDNWYSKHLIVEDEPTEKEGKIYKAQWKQ